MTNRSQKSGQRTAICHFSLGICHLSFAKSPAMPCDRSTEGQDLSSGPKRLRKAYSQRSTPKATQPEKAASPFLRMSKVSPKKFRWKLIDPIASAPAEDHLRFHRLELLRQEFWVARRIEKRI